MVAIRKEILKQDIRQMETTEHEARLMVDTYYTIQDQRVRTNNQIQALIKLEEPHAVLDFLVAYFEQTEKDIQYNLDKFTKHYHMGVWARQTLGIGPVISAGLLAHIDMDKCKTAGALWRFAGLDPTRIWEKGQKRPWNARLKVLCWKIGESFNKQKSRGSFYAGLIDQRRAYEEPKNDRLEYKELAAAGAARVKKTTEAYKYYKEGKLPPGHMHARAKRWAVKIFLGHWFEEAYRNHYGGEPPAWAPGKDGPYIPYPGTEKKV